MQAEVSQRFRIFWPCCELVDRVDSKHLAMGASLQVVDQVRGSKAALEAAIYREYIRMRELT